MSFFPRMLERILLIFTIAFTSLPVHASTIFYFGFDNQGLVEDDGPLIGPLVGTGKFISPIDLGPGTYQLNSLSGFSLNFDFIDGNTYTAADIATPPTGVAVKVTDLGAGVLRLFFTEGSGPGAIGGPYGGALDLTNGSNFLSFEPSFAGGNFLYIGGDQANSLRGRYVALSNNAIPEPTTIALVLLGLTFFTIFGRTKNGKSATSYFWYRLIDAMRIRLQKFALVSTQR